MSRFFFIVFVLVTLVTVSDAINPEKCKLLPKEKHCLIEYRVRYHWSHQVRFVYNWYTKSCFEIRWSDNCPPVAVPATSNNFATEQECLYECGGWA